MFALPVLIFLAAVAPAAQSPAAAADQLVEEGFSLREQGQDTEALAKFRQAFGLMPTPRTQAQIALAEQALGLWLEAEVDLSAALSQKRDPWIRRRTRQLNEALVIIQGNIGRVMVDGGPGGAQVRLNNRSVGVLPLSQPVKVVAGSVVLEVSAKGHLTARRTLQVEGGGLSREIVNLLTDNAPAPHVAEASVPTQQASSPPSTSGADLQDSAKADEAGKTQGWGRTAGWGLAAGSLVAVGTGVLFHLAWQNQVSRFEDSCWNRSTPKDAADGQQLCQDVYDKAGSNRTFSFLGYGVAAAMAGGAAYLLLRDPPSSPGTREQAAVAWTCTPGLSFEQIVGSCQGLF